jgi:hypothetical protein
LFLPTAMSNPVLPEVLSQPSAAIKQLPEVLIDQIKAGPVQAGLHGNDQGRFDLAQCWAR